MGWKAVGAARDEPVQSPTSVAGVAVVELKVVVEEMAVGGVELAVDKRGWHGMREPRPPSVG
jgi:hypothetical protein